jgi:adenylate kinase family enzyme
MSYRPKLVLLYGAAGVGKTTITARYIEEHPFTLGVDGDELVVMIGQWLHSEEAARRQVFEFTKAMASIHLKAGHDVLVPYLPTDAVQLQIFEELADTRSADFIEIELAVSKDEAVRRLMQRGTWGEKGTDPITEADIPVIEGLYDTMQEVLSTRRSIQRVVSPEGAVDAVYQSVKEIIGGSQKIY